MSKYDIWDVNQVTRPTGFSYQTTKLNNGVYKIINAYRVVKENKQSVVPEKAKSAAVQEPSAESKSS